MRLAVPIALVGCLGGAQPGCIAPDPRHATGAIDNPVTITITDWHPGNQLAPPRPPTASTGLGSLIGQRDPRAPIVAALAWAHTIALPATRVEPADVRAGDLLVFDHVFDPEHAGDLVGIALDRDPRGVIAFVYVAGGVVRRGLVDPAHPATHRDRHGATLNTFLRHGPRWPPTGTHYLSGELLAAVVRA